MAINEVIYAKCPYCKAEQNGQCVPHQLIPKMPMMK